MGIRPTTEFEEALRKKGYKSIVGIDEVGRGAWAGPLVAAACILPESFTSEEIRDSKQLSPKLREQLSEQIKKEALGFGIGAVAPFEIDLFGLTQATQLAFRRAITDMKCSYDYILTDAFVVEGSRVPCEGVIKGDEKILSVAAASIIAKVARDAMMQDYAAQFPDYGFDHNVGYGTALHLKAIKEKGLLAIHRKLFIRNLMAGLPVV